MVFGEGEGSEACGKRSEVIGSPWDGGMVGFGAGGLYSWGPGEADGARHYDVRLSSEATTDTVQNGFEVGRENERIIRSGFLICNIASLTPHLIQYHDLSLLQIYL